MSNGDRTYAEDDQFDLFYLVDCVLDEIELAKQARSGENQLETMPEATEDFYTPDLMDQFESPARYSDSDQSYSSPDTTSYMSNGTDLYSSLPPELAVELIQNDIERECLSNYTRRDVPGEIPMATNSTQNEYLHVEPYTSHDECASHDNYKLSSVPTYFDYGQKTGKRNSICDVQRDSLAKSSDPSSDRNSFTVNRDLPKEFSDLQHYTDILQSQDLGHGGQGQSLASRSPVSYSMPSSSSDQFYSEDSNDTTSSEFVSWTCKHPENWSAAEVLDWLYYSAERNGIDCSLLRGESFRTVTGAILCEMGPEGFSQLEPNYGSFLYKLFRQLINGLRFTLPPEAQTSFQEHSDLETYYPDSSAQACYQSGQTSHDRIIQSQFTVKQPYAQNTSARAFCQYQQKEAYAYDYAVATTSAPCHNGGESVDFNGFEYARDTSDHKYDQIYRCEYPVSTCSMASRDQYRSSQSKVSSIRAKYGDGITPRRRPGRPRIKSLPTEEELAAQREKKLKSQHLWEFIFELLNKPAYNPSVLKWENQSEGTFRFIQSETVAQLWGTLKSNENMTYEKLSRAMRHYYKRGILERVEGRRLVYKFSRVTLEKMKEKLAAKATMSH